MSKKPKELTSENILAGLAALEAKRTAITKTLEAVMRPLVGVTLSTAFPEQYFHPDVITTARVCKTDGVLWSIDVVTYGVSCSWAVSDYPGHVSIYEIDVWGRDGATNISSKNLCRIHDGLDAFVRHLAERVPLVHYELAHVLAEA